MSEPIPEEYMDLFEKRAFAHLATLLPDGTPHVTPVWVDYDGEHLLVNTPQGNRKDRNIQERPHIALSIQDPENPYRYLAVRGRVVASTDEGARDHIEKLARRYTGANYQGPPGPRHLHRIVPDRVFGLSRPRRK